MQSQIQQLPIESTKSYELFCSFAGLGPRRNISKFADKNCVSRQLIYNLANKNSWSSRLETLDRETRNKLSYDTIEKLQTLQEGELQLIISSYQSLQTAIKLANNAIQNFDPADYDFEHILKVTSNFINQMNKYQKVNEILERKLEKHDIFSLSDYPAQIPTSNTSIPKSPNYITQVELSSNSKSLTKNQLSTPKSKQNQTTESPKYKSKTEISPKKSRQNFTQEEVILSKEEKENLELIKKELLEVTNKLADKQKLKSMGHTKVRKLHKRKKELLLQM